MTASDAKTIAAYRIEGQRLVPMDEAELIAGAERVMEAVGRGEAVSQAEANQRIDAMLAALRDG